MIYFDRVTKRYPNGREALTNASLRIEAGSAIDPATGIEASVIGPASAPQSVMAEQARRKLEYVMRKKS